MLRKFNNKNNNQTKRKAMKKEQTQSEKNQVWQGCKECVCVLFAVLALLLLYAAHFTSLSNIPCDGFLMPFSCTHLNVY